MKREDNMSQSFNSNIRLAIGKCQELISLAQRGQQQCNDDSCSLIWKSLQVDLTKHLKQLEGEVESHKSKSKWD
jgi:hypothetical protein